ncbi:hypothetical protein D3C78_1947780 [compost metagenome]
MIRYVQCTVSGILLSQIHVAGNHVMQSSQASAVVLVQHHKIASQAQKQVAVQDSITAAN